MSNEEEKWILLSTANKALEQKNQRIKELEAQLNTVITGQTQEYNDLSKKYRSLLKRYEELEAQLQTAKSEAIIGFHKWMSDEGISQYRGFNKYHWPEHGNTYTIEELEAAYIGQSVNQKIMNTPTGAELIAQERKEQIEKHNRTVSEDVELNHKGQLIDAVRQLIRPDSARDPLEKALQSHGFTTPVGWNLKIFTHMMTKLYKERLIIAGALIAAEIDRLQGGQSVNTLTDRTVYGEVKTQLCPECQLPKEAHIRGEFCGRKDTLTEDKKEEQLQKEVNDLVNEITDDNCEFRGVSTVKRILKAYIAGR